MNDRREHDRIDAEIARSENSSDPFAAAVRTTRMPMLITDPNQHDNPIIFVNDAFLAMSGYGREEIIGCNCRFLQGPETDPAAIARVRDAIERRVPIEIELLNHKKDGEVFWNRLLISPVFDSDHSLTYFFASQFDVTLERDRLVRLQRDRDALEREVERRTTDLSRSEERLRFMLRAGRFGTWTLDLAERRLVASDLCKENCGRPAGEPFSYEDLLAAIVQEDRARMQEAMRESIENRTDYDVECRVKTLGGVDRWVQFRGQTFFHADGAPLSMAGVSIDISERKRGDQQRALLAGELNHRVKNSMATVQSIVHQTLRSAASLDGARTALDARLQSLSSAHDVLTREHWVGTALAEVVDSALKPFRTKPDTRFKIGGPDVRLSPRLTLAFVMALHELATNAVKYGALSNDRGFVILSWDVVDGSSPARLWLRWEECGGPEVVTPARKGFGTRMIERALALELGGTATIDYRPRGVVLSVEAPLPEQQASADPEGARPAIRIPGRASYGSPGFMPIPEPLGSSGTGISQSRACP